MDSGCHAKCYNLIFDCFVAVDYEPDDPQIAVAVVVADESVQVYFEKHAALQLVNLLPASVAQEPALFDQQVDDAFVLLK